MVVASGAPNSPPVWDLGSTSQRSVARPRRADHGGPIAAALGALASFAVVVPGLMTSTRWCLLVSFGSVALLVGSSALRRHQTRAALLLALAGILAAVGATTAEIIRTTHEPPAVTNDVVTRSALLPSPDTMITSSRFAGLPEETRSETRAFLSALVLQMQTLHGSWAPFPESLGVSGGSVVEGAGILRGTSLGTLPDGERLIYEVASSGTSFRVVVVSTTDGRATIWAGDSFRVPGVS